MLLCLMVEFWVCKDDDRLKEMEGRSSLMVAGENEGCLELLVSGCEGCYVVFS